MQQVGRRRGTRFSSKTLKLLRGKLVIQGLANVEMFGSDSEVSAGPVYSPRYHVNDVTAVIK